jgi:hypothetical protein
MGLLLFVLHHVGFRDLTSSQARERCICMEGGASDTHRKLDGWRWVTTINTRHCFFIMILFG